MKKTALHAMHLEQGAKMGEFAGYDMPLYYPGGVLEEHNAVRESAGLFDVSHMGQVIVSGAGATAFIETITPSYFQTAPNGRAKYTVLTTEEGGIVDDLIITKLEDEKYFIVINAGCKEKDLAWMEKHLPSGVTLEHLEERSLLALQGHVAETVLREVLQIDVSELPYMVFQSFGDIFVSRLGYTGEDGVEISVPNIQAADMWRKLTDHDSVRPIGLAARDSLRLEMGYPLYGHDIDDSTSPVEAGLRWVISKNNSTFLGHDIIRDYQEHGTETMRIGIKIKSKGIAREGAEILNENGKKIGTMTSGGFSPVLDCGVGQGYVDMAYTEIGTTVKVIVRNRSLDAEIAGLSFIKPRTKSAKLKAA